MIRIFVIVLFAVATSTIWSQGKTVSPPAENLPRAEQEKWLVQAIAKYGSYDEMTTAIKISAAKIHGCALSYTQTKRFGATKEQNIIVTTRTDSVKNDIIIDLAKLEVDTMKLSEHMYPEVMTLSFRMRDSVRDTEIILRQTAAEAIKTTIERVARACQRAH